MITSIELIMLKENLPRIKFSALMPRPLPQQLNTVLTK